MIVFAFVVSFTSMERKVDIATSVVKEFTETVQYKGLITKSQYENINKRIPYKNYKLQLTHIKKSATGSEDVMDIHFPYEIKKSIVETGVYKMNTGDQIKVDLIVKDKSVFDMIAFMLYKKETSRTKIIASNSGVILNEKY
jgi:hypothetical protein